MTSLVPPNDGRAAGSAGPESEREQARLAALLSYDILDTDKEAAFEGLVDLAAGICNAPIAAISLVDERRQWFKARRGLNVSETSLDIALCRDVVRSGQPLCVGDLRTDPRFADHPVVTREGGLRFYAAWPLVAPGNHVLGTICVADVKPHPDCLTEWQGRSLATLASQIVAQMELRRKRPLPPAAVSAAQPGDTRWREGYRDPLTGVADRTQFRHSFGAMIDAAQKTGRRVGLLRLNIENFGRINDEFGQDAGDAVLRSFGARLTGAVRPTDVVGRLGSDKFAVALPVPDEDALLAVAISLAERMRQPFVFNGLPVTLQTSFGAALYPDHGMTVDSLHSNSKIALQMARTSTQDHVLAFHPTMRRDVDTRSQMIARARQACNSRQIEPYYQPQVALESGRIVGFEALLRWRDSRYGIQYPDSISAAFDDPEIAVLISNLMIDSVFADIASWLSRGLNLDHVAINAAAADLLRSDFPDLVLMQLKEKGLPTSILQIEVTETVFLGRGAERVEEALMTLSREGATIALDDFGTGYASLAHLKQFPVDVIKIDRSFITGVESDSENQAIVSAITGLGHSLAMKVVAEGVETMEQVNYLRAIDCDMIQGFLISHAMPAGSVPDFIAGWQGFSPHHP